MALLIENATDAMATLRWSREDDGQTPKPVQGRLFEELTEPEKHVIDLIQDAEEIGVDQLSYASKIGQGDLASLLLNLEFKGLVRSLPGKRYVLC